MSHILLVNELAELRAEIARLKADTERLEMLDSDFLSCEETAMVVNGYHFRGQGYKSLRDTIDAAIDAARAEKP